MHPDGLWSVGILNKWSITDIPNAFPHLSLGLLDAVGGGLKKESPQAVKVNAVFFQIIAETCH